MICPMNSRRFFHGMIIHKVRADKSVILRWFFSCVSRSIRWEMMSRIKNVRHRRKTTFLPSTSMYLKCARILGDMWVIASCRWTLFIRFWEHWCDSLFVETTQSKIPLRKAYENGWTNIRWLPNNLPIHW